MLKLERAAFALGLVALGVVTLVFGDFALQWQPVPAWIPGRQFLAYASGVVLLATGSGLLSARAAVVSSRVAFVYALLWFVLLKLPHVAIAPLVEVNWMSAGEIAVLLVAGWVLVDADVGNARIARFLFGAALIPLGLSHFVYSAQTIGLVPTWIPFRAFWAYLGGAGHIAAGIGVCFGIYPRLAATLEASMIGIFTILVWVPGVASAPTNRLQWTGMIMSWIIGAGAWVVAGSFARRAPAPSDGGARGGSLRESPRSVATSLLH